MIQVNQVEEEVAREMEEKSKGQLTAMTERKDTIKRRGSLTFTLSGMEVGFIKYACDLTGMSTN